MEQYFSELANPVRYQILKILETEALSLSKIAKKIESVSNSEVSRHLSRLVSSRFIMKEESGRNYVLSDYGNSILSFVKPMAFLFTFRDYFSKHSIQSLPEQFRTKIDSLEGAELIQGTGNIMIEFQNLVNLPGKQLKVMLDTRFPFQNLEINTDYICHIDMKSIPPSKEKPPTRHRFKFLPEIHISISFVDLGVGYIIFPLVGVNKPDYSCAFKITDERGMKFLEELWDYHWNLEKDFMLMDKNHDLPDP